MKIKNYRFPCEVCGTETKTISSIQVFFRKSGEVSYARARHFGASKKFYYHQQSREYTIQKLREISLIEQGIDPSQVSKNASIEQTGKELSSKLGSVAGGEGFEPSTPNLGGWCSIRTELPVHGNNALVGFAKQIPIDVLFKIKRIAEPLKGKGRQPSIIDSFLGDREALQSALFFY